MHAALFRSGGGVGRIHAAGSPAQPIGTAQSNFYCKEIADVVFSNAYNGIPLQCSRSSIRSSQGNRRGGHPQRDVSSNKKEAGKLSYSQSTDGEKSKSSNQEELLALFRRIQLSISKGRRTNASKRRTQSRLKENESAKSLFGVLQQHPARKESKEVPAMEENAMTLQKDDAPKVKAKIPASGNPKFPRPTSKFEKRSPIPHPSSGNVKTKTFREQSPGEAAKNVLEEQNVDEMKLSQLKELAKAKGIKGYSKLKKGELLDLLKGSLQ